jgi:hypothetical protein
VALIVVVGYLVSEPPHARALEKEIRDFVVRVDGKPAGYYRMTIENRDDGTQVMEGLANVTVSRLLVTYTYTYGGTEIWKDGRLVHLKSKSNDDGKRFEVIAWPDGDKLRIRSNNRDQSTVADAWLTTYWRAPDPKYRNRAVPLVDADNGRLLNGTLRHLGSQQITITGQAFDCTRYRLTGSGLQVELWYDSQERLVREESFDDGHRIVLELTRTTRP